MNGLHTWTAAAASFLLVLAGCGGGNSRPTGMVSGQITHHGGQSLTNAQITFYSSEHGDHGEADTGPEGRYTVKEPLEVGTYRVRVTPPPVFDPADGSPPPKPQENPNIPAKYRDYQTSGLTFKVEPGKNEFNVDLK